MEKDEKRKISNFPGGNLAIW